MNETRYDEHLEAGNLEIARLSLKRQQVRSNMLKVVLGILVTIALGAASIVQILAHDDRKLDNCQRKFDSAVSKWARETSIAQSELVVIIATVVPVDREAAITNQVVTIGHATDQYRIAGDARDAWVHENRPLPCPYEEAL